MVRGIARASRETLASPSAHKAGALDTLVLRTNLPINAIVIISLPLSSSFYPRWWTRRDLSCQRWGAIPIPECEGEEEEEEEGTGRRSVLACLSLWYCWGLRFMGAVNLRFLVFRVLIYIFFSVAAAAAAAAAAATATAAKKRTRGSGTLFRARIIKIYTSLVIHYSDTILYLCPLLK